MNTIKALQNLNFYENEHTLIGILGHGMVIFSLFSALIAAIYFIKASSKKEEDLRWRKWGIVSFRLHFIAVVSTALMLFSMIFNHYYEYEYVWKYSNNQMPLRYIFSCFWSGQQGSILLWTFWTGLIGVVLSKQKNSWQPYVLSIFAIIQVLLSSLLLGVYVGDLRIGESPFMLIRELPDNMIMPWAKMSDYIAKIENLQDGTGLNPLLQNYWMVIHPPTLFLGFAATQVPFVFAIAALWRKEFKAWIKPALPWTYFAIMVLGVGILMGGAWAYEALSFGGFWAWDPVENASFVPWLIIVGAGHCMLIADKKGSSTYSALFLAMMSFILVWYSTFLTRSGVLGESSVHSFTGDGMLGQLLVYLLLIFCISIGFLLNNFKLQKLYATFCVLIGIAYILSKNTTITFSTFLIGTIAFMVVGYEKHFSKDQKEEKLWSREFWMFLGTMLLAISAIQISVTTSIPVINGLFNTSFDAFTDLAERNHFYNAWQAPFAIAVTFLIGITQFMKYKHTNASHFFTQILKPLFVAAIISLLFFFLPIFTPTHNLHLLLVFSSIFAITANWHYVNSVLKGKMKNAGAAIAHIGFGMIMLGATLSTSGSKEISANSSGKDLQLVSEQFNNKENILLSKYDTLLMGDYFVTYRGKKQKGVNIYFDVGYYEAIFDESARSYSVGDSLFSLNPFVQLNEKFGNVAEPGTKHFLSHDVFTHIKWADMETSDSLAILDDYMSESKVTISVGDKFRHENIGGVFREIYLIKDSKKKEELGLRENDIVVEANINIREMSEDSEIYDIKPLFIIRDSSQVMTKTVNLPELDINFTIKELKTEDKTIVLGIQEREYIVMEAVVFPFINILWAGCFIMAIGCWVAIQERRRQMRVRL
ncbi:cytochrome c biogenesis protein CcsA [Sediminitomix flava]|uniref:Cytochrome c-type biogenesis protein CcmF n=1 Tax=Sediminitomix flava TaxID=379075 RepID=A0A315ZHY1_SEDFL|nr:cytochrome c biogenesis protein CcsA [Sediminitomix flava]PWJ44324.1 cytochrome c-type biogenesis protein CcmF [Sediminitomix flava]